MRLSPVDLLLCVIVIAAPMVVSSMSLEVSREAPSGSMSPSAPDEFWVDGFESARDVAASKRLTLLMYFPDPVADGDPPQMRSFPPAAGGFSTVARGVRVGAEEVKELVERYRIRRFPALVGVDPFGEVVKRWEGRWSARDVVRAVASHHKRLSRRLADLDARVADARSALEKRDFVASIKHCAEIIGRSASGYPQRVDVARLLGKIVAIAEGELAVTLAREGIGSDRELSQALEKLGRRFAGLHAFERRIDRELARLRGRRIGGG